MIIIFVFFFLAKTRSPNITHNIKNFASNGVYFTHFYFSLECGTESKLYQVIIPFLREWWMLEVVSLDRRYARYDAESIGAKVSAWWKLRKSIKGIEKNWEGFTVSFGTRFGGHVSLGNDIWYRMTRTLSTLANDFLRSIYDLLCYY